MKKSGRIATRAVPISMTRIPWTDINSNKTAPNGAETIFIPPCSIWLRPWTRARCSLGTISEVEACMAGQWKPPAVERMNISR